MTESHWDLHAIAGIIAGLKSQPGALLPILHGIQDAIGHVPPEAVPYIASELNLSRAEVHGVISFYHYFRETPPGRQTLYLCRAESCQAMGSELLEAHAMARLGIGYHETTSDGAISLEPVYCLGHCACSPALMLGREVYGRVTPERFDAIVETVQESA